MKQENKEAIIDELSTTKRKAHKLEISLMFKGNEAEAAKVKKKSRTLSKKIDNLIASSMESWVGSSQAIVSSLKETNKGLQDAIRDIKKDVKTAENVVKALENLDKAIKTAMNLLA
jgi:hypothetical protein